MKRDLKSYLAMVERTYFYRLKSILPLGEIEGTEEERVAAVRRLERIEQAVARYNPVSFEPVRRTMIQHLPLDFVNVQNREVYILDMVLALPVSPVALRMACKVAARIPDEFIVVHGEGDPLETAMGEADAVADMKREATENGWAPAALLDDSKNSEGETESEGYYGNKATSRFLQYLEQVREKNTGCSVETDESFNAEIADAPKVVPNAEDIDCDDTTETVVRRTYRDAEGKLHTLSRKVTKIGRGEA